jgi:hypothetical protein
MNWTDAIKLVYYKDEKNSNGFKVNDTKEESTTLPANIKSITRSEAEHSKKMGYDASITVELLFCNYDQKYTHIVDTIENKEYEIKRVYKKTSEILEITCSDISKNHG